MFKAKANEEKFIKYSYVNVNSQAESASSSRDEIKPSVEVTKETLMADSFYDQGLMTKKVSWSEQLEIAYSPDEPACSIDAEDNLPPIDSYVEEDNSSNSSLGIADDNVVPDVIFSNNDRKKPMKSILKKPTYESAHHLFTSATSSKEQSSPVLAAQKVKEIPNGFLKQYTNRFTFNVHLTSSEDLRNKQLVETAELQKKKSCRIM